MQDIINSLIQADTELLLALNGISSQFADVFMSLFTGKVIWVPMYLAILYIIYRNFNWKIATTIALFMVATITVGDQLCSSIIRPMVGRLRPSHIDNPIADLVYIVDGKRGGGFGFPSAHATNTFSLALFLIGFAKDRALALFMLSWAFINSYSRLYLGLHYPGDLIVGAILGGTIGYTMQALLSFSMSKLLETKSYNAFLTKKTKGLIHKNTIIYIGLLITAYICIHALVKTI